MAKGIYGFLLLFLVLHANAAKPVGHHESHDQVKPKQPQQLVQTEAGGEDDASMDILTDSIKSLFGSDAQAPPMPSAQPAAASAPAKTVKTATVAAAAATSGASVATKPVVAAAAKKPVAAEAKKAEAKPAAPAAVKTAVKSAVHAAIALEKKAVVKPESKLASEKKPVSKPVVAAAAKKPVSKPVSKPVVAAAAKKPVAKPVAAVAKKAEAKPVSKPVSKPAKAATPVAKVSAAAPKEVPAVPKTLLKKEASKATPAPKAPVAAAKVSPPAAPAAVAAPAVKAAVKVAAEAPKPKVTAPANATHLVANTTAIKNATHAANATAVAANKTEVPKAARLTMGVSGHLAAAPAAPLETPKTNKTITAVAKGENASTVAVKQEEAVKKAEVDDLPMAKLFVDDDPTPAPPVVVVNATVNKTANTKIAKAEKNLTAVNSTIVNATAVKKVQNATVAAAAVNKKAVQKSADSIKKETKEQELEAEVVALKAKLAAEEAAKTAKIATALKAAAVKAAKAKHTAPKPHQQVHAAPKAAAHPKSAPKPHAEHHAAAVHHTAPKTHTVAHVAAPTSHDLDAEEKKSIKRMLRNRVHKSDSPLKKFLKSLSDDDLHEQRTARPHHFNSERDEYRSRDTGLIKMDSVVAATPQEATAAPQARKVWSAPTTVQPADTAPVQLAAEEAAPAPQQTGFFGRLFSPITSFFSWMVGSKTAVAVHPAGHSQLSLLSQPQRQPKQDPSYTAWQTADAKMRLVEISDEWGRREQVDEDQVERIRDIDHTERVQAETKAPPQKVLPHSNGESHATSFWSTLQGQDQEIETSLKMDSLQKYQQLSRIQDEQVKHAVSVSDREALKMTLQQHQGSPAESQMIHDDWSQAENEDKVEEQQIHDSPDLQMIQKSHFRKRVTV